jgi:hypothetical protein
MDGTWKAMTVKFTDGKKAFHCSVSGVRMVIKDGAGTWSDGTHRGTVKVDLSAYSTAAPGSGSEGMACNLELRQQVPLSRFIVSLAATAGSRMVA